MTLEEELRMAAAGQERTWQAKLELRAAEEIERLEKENAELKKLARIGAELSDAVRHKTD